MKTIRARVITASVLVILVAGFVSLFVSDGAYRRNLDTVTLKSIDTAEKQFDGLQEAEIRRLYAAQDVLVRDGAFTDAFRNRDRAGLQRLMWPVFEVLRDVHDVSRCYVYDPESDARVFLRVYRGTQALDPSNYGDATDVPPVAIAQSTRKPSAGFVLGAGSLSMRAVTPWLDADGKTIGYLSLGREIGGFLESISEGTGDEYAMLLDKRLLDRERWAEQREAAGLSDNWNDHPNAVLVAATVNNPALVSVSEEEISLEKARALGSVAEGTSRYMKGAFPLRDMTGKRVGIIVVLKDVTSLTEAMRQTQVTLLLAVLVLVLVSYAAVSVVFDRLVLRRLDAMTQHLERMSLTAASGVTDEAEYTSTSSDDEIGRFERYFAEYMHVIAAAIASRGPGSEKHDADKGESSSE